MKAAHRPRPRSAQNLDRARENSQRLVRPSTAAGKLSVFSTDSSLWPSSASSNPLLFIADDAFERQSSVQSAAAADWPESDLREQQTTTAAVSGASFSPVLHPESFEREWNIMQAELQRCMRVRSKAALEVEEERIMHRGEVARLKGMLEKERSDKQAVSSSVVELQQELSEVKQLLLRHSSLDEASSLHSLRLPFHCATLLRNRLCTNMPCGLDACQVHKLEAQHNRLSEALHKAKLAVIDAKNVGEERLHALQELGQRLTVCAPRFADVAASRLPSIGLSVGNAAS